MTKSLYIAEKPSVAQEFAKALKENMGRRDGYVESENFVVTWCVGHLVTMSYPEKYDMKFKRWSLETLPFLPEKFKYEVIPAVQKQFTIVSGLLNREDIDTIYVCTDSGREGEYIYRLVEMMAGVKGKKRKRVWIDSQTEEEILRGIREAKDLSEYDHLSDSAYLRAKEDYLMGINFSRVLSLKYGNAVSSYLGTKYQAISVGRVMTCVLGMVVRREREIREFVKTPFYKENGFKEEKDAKHLIEELSKNQPLEGVLEKIEKKKENKNAPLLYNLAELQNDCARLFKISPDQTLQAVQEMYEKKLVTYPRTDARVLSSAVAKEISKNLNGLMQYPQAVPYLQDIQGSGSYKNIAKTRYTNDKQITDHYAIIPTGQGLQNLKNLSELSNKIYEVIVRRFLSIFYPPAVYQKVALTIQKDGERFFSNFKVLLEEGYLKVMHYSFSRKKEETQEEGRNSDKGEETSCDVRFLEAISELKKGSVLPIGRFVIKEGETSPPKRYTSGSMILAMENAGQLIEDEELRAQIKGSGIGTSATRAEILKKLFSIKYLALNKKTQVITPTLLGEMIFEVVNASIRSLLNPELTASWEKGLTYVAEGSISSEEYMGKLENFVTRHTHNVIGLRNQTILRSCFDAAAANYKKPAAKSKKM